jgi:hypothetical protein
MTTQQRYTKEERSQIAQTIAAQLGGIGRIRLMTGARNFVALDGNGGLMFQFKGWKRNAKCIIELNAMDTYTFKLVTIGNARNGFKVTEHYKLEGVYNDMLIDLFESETGLYLSL